MSKVEKFEDLICWQKSRMLVNKIYNITGLEPFDRDYNLKSQIRRAAISVTSNIAEGFRRFHQKEFIRFLDIAQSSAAEVKSQLYTAQDQNYIDKNTADDLFSLIKEVRKTLPGLIKHLDRNNNQVQEPTADYDILPAFIRLPDDHLNTVIL